MSRRAVAGLIALLGALLGLFLALRGPSKSECQARASILEEDCRHAPLAIHVEEDQHDDCRALYDDVYAQCLRAFR